MRESQDQLIYVEWDAGEANMDNGCWEVGARFDEDDVFMVKRGDNLREMLDWAADVAGSGWK